ncbi:MAG TPA: biopolymer transporter ExbD [Casimicrobium sp.]|jgi:biopolymer transport protein ExbD|nr:biopolymer transporter ExbD [Casimicrobium sp.]HPG63124.1 biopolymer transporter ExbD [Casimicrobium sp.]HPT55167.1 biopolymer transporter ExbD [Casimicrobium sp.]
MGMNLGNSGGGNADPEVMVDLNTTPLIDVMLVLIVMLIITIPVQLHSINMNMPPPSVNKPLTEPEVVKLDIDEKSLVYWNGALMNSRAELEAKMTSAAAQAVQPEIHLRPNKLAKYEMVAYVMAATQRIGLVKMGILGHEQFL